MIKNKYVTIFAYLIVVLGVLIGSHYLLKPVEAKSKVKLYEAKYEGFIEDLELDEVLDINSPIISEKILANINGMQVTLYGAKQANDFGDIELIIAIDNNGLVIAAKALRVNQTFSVEQLTDLIVDMEGKTIQTPAGSVTGVTIGSQTIQNILSAIEEEHFRGLDEIQTMYGRGAKLGKLEEVDRPGIVNVQPVLLNNNVIGNIYELLMTYEDETGSLTVSYKVYLNSDDELMYYQILKYEGDSLDPSVISVDDLLEFVTSGGL